MAPLERLEPRAMLAGDLVQTASLRDAYGFDNLVIEAFQAGSTLDIDDLRVTDLQSGQVVYANDFNSGSTNGLTLTYWRDSGVAPEFDASKTRIVNNRLRLETTGFGQNGSGGYDSKSRLVLGSALPANFEVSFLVYKHQWAGHAHFMAVPSRAEWPYFVSPNDGTQAPGGFFTNIQGGQINTIDVVTDTGPTQLRSVAGSSGPYDFTDVRYRLVKQGSTFAVYVQDVLLGSTTSLATIPNQNAPTDVVLSGTTVAENQPAGTVVGAFSTVDPDAGDTFTYALVAGTGATDNGSFTIVGNQLRAGGAFDYETKNSYSIRVRATDLGGLFTEKSFTVAVVNLGEAAPDLQQGLLARYELDGNGNDSSGNGRNGTAANTANAQDRYGRNNSAMSFNGTNAVVTVPHNAAFNALPLSMSMWFKTTATAGGIVGKYQAGGWNGYQVTIGPENTVWPWYVMGRGQDVIGNYDVNGDNNPAFRTTPLNDGTWHNLVFTVDASGGAVFVDGVLQATKGWRGDPTVVTNTLPLSIGQYLGETAGYFAGLIDDVRLYDRVLSAAEVGQLLTAAPTNISLSGTTVVENQSAGTTVGTFSTVDPDAGDTFTYALVPGAGATDNGSFTIVGNQLRTGAAFDYETKSSYSIRVRSTDAAGLFTEKSFTVTVTDVIEGAQFAFGFKHVNETGADAYLIDSTGMRKYSEWQSTPITYWGPSANNVEGRLVYKFPFASMSQSIRLLASSPTWDFFNEPGGTGRGASALEVSRDGETWVSLRNGLEPRQWGMDWSYDESLPASVLGGQALWVRMRFYVESAPNSSYTVAQFGRSTATATSNVFGLTAVLGSNSAPTDIVLAGATVAENQSAGTVVGTLSTVDPDVGDTFTYALVPGAGATDNGSFTIVGNQLRTGAVFDYETKSSSSVRIRATDANGLFTEKAFTITIDDVQDEALAVQEVVSPEPGVYAVGQRMEFTVVLSRPVEVRGRPQMQFLVGRSTRSASYVVGSGSDELTFEYIVTRRDHTASVAVGQRFVFPRRSAIVAGTTVLAAQLPVGVAGVVCAGVTIDARPPTVVGRVRVPQNGTYAVGQALDFTVRYSEPVVVEGEPWIALQGMETARVAEYLSGAGTPELTFRYVVQAGDRIRASSGLRLGRTIELGADGYISDEAGNDAALSVTAPTMRGIRIDGTTIVAAALLADQGSNPRPKQPWKPIVIRQVS